MTTLREDKVDDILQNDDQDDHSDDEEDEN